MKRLRTSLPVLVVAALALACTAVSGCGSASGDGDTQAEAQPSQAYEQILHGLHHAALANGNFKAARKAKSLKAAEKAALESFCNFAWQIHVNGEEAKLAKHRYIVGRITSYAEFSLDRSEYPEVDAAMNQLRSVIDLSALTGDLSRRYSKACYA